MSIPMGNPAAPGQWTSRTGTKYTPDANGVIACALADVVDALNAGFSPLPTSSSSATVITSAASGLTAFAGGGQTNALALTAVYNRVTTVASAADSVRLPPAVPGLSVWLCNSGANPMQVFGAGTDTINDVATATGISQPPNSVDIYSCQVAGKWYVEAGVGFSGQLATQLAKDSIVAFAGGGQGSATALTADMNRVITVTTAGDSVKLPASAAGLDIWVINRGANAMQVYGAGTDTINDVATATGVSQAAGSLVIYSCVTAGAWYAEGLGTGYSGSFQTLLTSSAVSAAGTTQGTATALTGMVNRVTTVGANSGVVLPANAAGMQIVVVNAGANALNVYPDTGAAINGLGTNIGTPLPVGGSATFTCMATNVWSTLPVSPREASAALNSVGAGTLTAAAIVGGLVTRGGAQSGAAFTDTSDTAANIILALHGATVGQSFELTIDNNTNAQETLAGGTGVTFSGQTIIPQNSWWRGLVTYSAAATVTIQGLAVGPNAPMPSTLFTALAGGTPLTLTGAQMAGAQDVTINLTNALGGAGTLNCATAAQIVAAIPNAQAGQTYKLRIINSSSGAFSWTLTTATGITLTGTMTIAQNTFRDFYVTLTTLSAVAIQQIGTGTTS